MGGVPCENFARPPQYLILVLLVGKEAPDGDHGYETRKGQGRDLNLCSLLYGRAHNLESGSRVRHQSQYNNNNHIVVHSIYICQIAS